MESTTNFDFSPAKLDDIYLGLSEKTKDYQTLNKDQQLLSIIDICFNDKLKQIDSKRLINDVNLLNGSFVKFYHDCKENYITNVADIFIFYCEYFSLDYNAVYVKLHVKLKTLIEDMLIYKIGGYEVYDNLKKKHGVSQHTTLFDLLNKK